MSASKENIDLIRQYLNGPKVARVKLDHLVASKKFPVFYLVLVTIKTNIYSPLLKVFIAPRLPDPLISYCLGFGTLRDHGMSLCETFKNF